MDPEPIPGIIGEKRPGWDSGLLLGIMHTYSHLGAIFLSSLYTYLPVIGRLDEAGGTEKRIHMYRTEGTIKSRESGTKDHAMTRVLRGSW